MELLVCYEDEGVYVNTYGRITKDVVLQWGEMPTSVGRCLWQVIHNVPLGSTSVCTWAKGRGIGFDFRFRSSDDTVFLADSCAKWRVIIWICFVRSFLRTKSKQASCEVQE